MNRNAINISIATAALLAGLASYSWFPSVKAKAIALPSFTFQDIEGNQRNSEEWKGKVLIVNFWATWCAPCRKEIPEFIELQTSYGDRGLQFIGIAIEDKQPAAAFAKKIGINYPILIGEYGGTELSYQLGNTIQALPFSAIVDREGMLLHGHPGILTKEKITEIITPHLNRKQTGR